MSFNFFGTFTSAQWDDFLSFVSIQRVDLQARYEWLDKQLSRNGIFSTEYDDVTNNPTPYDPETKSGGFMCSPVNSYGAKLLTAYRMLGGTPELDMLLRTTDKPVFLTRGVNTATGDGAQRTGYSDVYSNGRRDRGGMRFDRDLGLLVNAVKSPIVEAIKLKRERLEFKLKRALDYSDQLQREYNMIATLIGDGQGSAGSFDDLISKANLSINTPGSFGVIDSDDRFGKNIGRMGDFAFDDETVDDVDANANRVPK